MFELSQRLRGSRALVTRDSRNLPSEWMIVQSFMLEATFARRYDLTCEKKKRMVPNCRVDFNSPLYFLNSAYAILATFWLIPVNCSIRLGKEHLLILSFGSCLPREIRYCPLMNVPCLSD